MRRDASTWFTGGAFAVAAGLLWLGWMVMPMHLGTYFEAGDFGEIHPVWTLWVWTYRFHLFGHVISVLGLLALGSLLTRSRLRPVITAGVGVASAGIFITMIAHAFYYHFGAWGALEMQGKSQAELTAYVSSLSVSTEYVTCLTRFGRVFSGVGLIVLGAALWIGGHLPRPIAATPAFIGLASIALTMAFGDNLSYYEPIFHLKVVWLAAMGIVIVRRGVAEEPVMQAAAPAGKAERLQPAAGFGR